MNLTSKYRGLTADPVDGSKLFWNGHPDGLPIRQEHARAVVNPQQLAGAGQVLYARSEVLKIPEQLARYTEIMDWLGNGLGVLRFEEKQPTAPGEWVSWLVWFDVRGVIPAAPPGPPR
jgi:hypothetical protein